MKLTEEEEAAVNNIKSHIIAWLAADKPGVALGLMLLAIIRPNEGIATGYPTNEMRIKVLNFLGWDT